MNKDRLPDPPRVVHYEGVEVRFSHFTAGDDARGFVPGYHFRILNSVSADVGHINFRVGDSEHVRMCAGHIGFEIHAENRGHGYAGQACLALSEFISCVSGNVILTADPDNIPSLKTIERIGAEFIDEIDVPKHDAHYAKGRFRKKRYRWEPK